MTDLERADQCSADLIHSCYGKLGHLAAVLRIENGELRIIAPADRYESLALMFYRAADEMATHAARVKLEGDI